MAKHMVVPVDSVIKECIQFLEQCEGESLSHAHTPNHETMKLISDTSCLPLNFFLFDYL